MQASISPFSWLIMECVPASDSLFGAALAKVIASKSASKAKKIQLFSPDSLVEFSHLSVRAYAVGLSRTPTDGRSTHSCDLVGRYPTSGALSGRERSTSGGRPSFPGTGRSLPSASRTLTSTSVERDRPTPRGQLPSHCTTTTSTGLMWRTGRVHPVVSCVASHVPI